MLLRLSNYRNNNINGSDSILHVYYIGWNFLDQKLL